MIHHRMILLLGQRLFEQWEEGAHVTRIANARGLFVS